MSVPATDTVFRPTANTVARGDVHAEDEEKCDSNWLGNERANVCEVYLRLAASQSIFLIREGQCGLRGNKGADAGYFRNDRSSFVMTSAGEAPTA
jgi:hypothetical protein